MQQLAREKHDLILPRNNFLIGSGADIALLFHPRIVNAQLSPFEQPRLAMEKVHKGQMAGRDPITAIVAVKTEKISIVAGGDLRLHAGYVEFLHPQLLEDL